jgi:probable phosphoglycerate mutase
LSENRLPLSHGHQAEALAERLKPEHFDCIYSSDLLRAVQTAEVVAAARRSCNDCCIIDSITAAGGGATAVRVDQRLRERYLGVLQGLTHAEAAEQQPQAYAALHAQGTSAELVSCAAAHDLQSAASAHASQELRHGFTGVACSQEAAPDGQGAPESVDKLCERAAAVLEDLAAQHPGQRLLVVTHGGFLQAVQR